MNDIERAKTVPCPVCKMGADQRCVDIANAGPDGGGPEVDGVHQPRIYRAYFVAAAIAENRAIELEAALDEVLSAFRRSLARGMQWHRGEVAAVLHRLNKSFPKEHA